MGIIGQTLEAIYSKRDKFGNCYWALRYTDHKTGQEVCGKISGGESNIKGILMHWNNPDGWDRSVSFDVLCLPIRQFNWLTKKWKYAGCSPEDLAVFIRSGLQA